MNKQEEISFENQFKVGDMICSDRFHNGKVMIVEELKFSHGEFRYRCQDLVIENQKWAAYELDRFCKKSNEWRLATDDDIVNYLSNYVRPSQLDIRYNCTVEVVKYGLLVYGPNDESLYFDEQETRALKKYLNKWVIG